MSTSPSETICNCCGAQNRGEDNQCWLCSAPLSAHETQLGEQQGKKRPLPAIRPFAPEYGPANHSVGDELPGSTGQFSLATLFLLITFCAILMGMFSVAPGLAIGLAILAVPPLIRTALIVQRRKDRGATIEAGGKVALFLASLGVTVLVIILALVSSIGVFCGVCLSIGKDSAIPIAGFFALVTTIVVLIFSIKWMRARWRQDAGRK